MAVEQGRCLFRVFADFGRSKFLSRHPNYFCNRSRHERLDPVETLDSTFIAPAIEQLLPNFHRRDVSKCAANFIRIENPGCVTVRVEKNQGTWLIKLNRLSKPVKRARMI